MPVEIIRDGAVVQRSRNLRGIIQRAGRVGVRFAAVHRDRADGSALVTVSFADNSCVETRFADWSIAFHWVDKRSERWRLLYRTVNVPDCHWSWQ